MWLSGQAGMEGKVMGGRGFQNGKRCETGRQFLINELISLSSYKGVYEV